MDQRRAYLEFYAPILFKKAHESGGWAGPDARAGRGWMSNFDFDNDQQFSNNKENWEELSSYMDGDQPDWDIRPTMYSAMLEYTDGAGGKSATLIYLPYFAKQKGSIHDWERIEIRLSDITGDPGTGEEVDYAVITEHSKHNTRPGGDEDLNFATTTEGKHLMIWRADQTTGFDPTTPNRPFGGELHWVEETYQEVLDLMESPSDTAKVDINGNGQKGFHYVFVPEFDPDMVELWGARPLTAATADQLAVRQGTSSVDVDEVKHIQFELQDLADIADTHWEGGLYDRHWDGKVRNILIEEPIPGGIDGGPSVPSGVQAFHSQALDTEDDDEDRKGIINKHWFWGTYLLGCGGNGKVKDGLFDVIDEGSFTSEAFNDGAPNGTRFEANGYPESAGSYWAHHDYFAHDGTKASSCDTTGDSEIGRWLPAGWHLDANGGFDGRWVPLFPG